MLQLAHGCVVNILSAKHCIINSLSLCRNAKVSTVSAKTPTHVHQVSTVQKRNSIEKPPHTYHQVRTTSRHDPVSCFPIPTYYLLLRSLKKLIFSCDLSVGCLLLVPTSTSWPTTPGWWAWSWCSPGRTSASRHADSWPPRLCGHPDNTYRPL